MLSFKNYISESCDCWTGYKRKPGTKPCTKGSCIKEENTQGDEGTDKLTRHRKKLTPSEPLVTPEPLKNFETYK